MYADSIVMLSGKHEDAQHALDLLSNWCTTWGMKVNIKKSHVVHHHNHQRPRHDQKLMLCGAKMEYVPDYNNLAELMNSGIIIKQ